MDDLKNLLGLFETIEPLQKEVEGLGNGLDGPALNEVRNATYHLLLALSGDQTKRAEQIGKAERHAQRAIYDCSEAMILSELEKLRLFKEDYRLVTIGETLPSYQEDMVKAGEALNRINEARKNKLDRNQFYQEVHADTKELKRINVVCAAAREELNKRIRAQNRRNTTVRVGLILAILTLVVTLIAWLYPQSPK